MKHFSFTLTTVALLIATVSLFSLKGNTSGDSPFPLVGEEENVELAQIWETMDGAQKVKIYKTEAGDSYVVIENETPKKIEILKRTK